MLMKPGTVPASAGSEAGFSLRSHIIRQVSAATAAGCICECDPRATLAPAPMSLEGTPQRPRLSMAELFATGIEDKDRAAHLPVLQTLDNAMKQL